MKVVVLLLQHMILIFYHVTMLGDMVDVMEGGEWVQSLGEREGIE